MEEPLLKMPLGHAGNCHVSKLKQLLLLRRLEPKVEAWREVLVKWPAGDGWD